jgi:hypothetical protein
MRLTFIHTLSLLSLSRCGVCLCLLCAISSACVRQRLTAKWSSARISFEFKLCALCQSPMSHPLLTDLLRPLYHLESQVKAMSLQRLEFEALTDHTDIVTPGGRFYKDPSAFAINHYSQSRETACMLCCRLQPRCRSDNTFDICLTRIFAFLFAVLLSVLSLLHFLSVLSVL